MYEKLYGFRRIFMERHIIAVWPNRKCENISEFLKTIFNENDKNFSNYFRGAEVSFNLAEDLLADSSFTRVFPLSTLIDGEGRILGIKDNITYFQSIDNRIRIFYSGNYGCEGSRVK
jgi:hypothetical protein